MKQRLKLNQLTLLTISVVGIGLIFALYVLKHPYSKPGSAGPQYDNEDSGPGFSADWATDFRDNRKLVGFVQNIFAGKVLKQIGGTAPHGFAHLQYEVKVLYNIKGNVSGTIIVDIEVGNGGTLAVGATYLFSTLHFESLDPGYYVPSHPALKTLISENSSLEDAQLIQLVLRHNRTYELLNAYPNEILYDIHVARGISANSFTSLSKSEKEVIYNKFSELIPPHPIPETLPPPPPSPSWETIERGTRCFDGIDNDGDGLIDRQEAECYTYYREDLPSFCKDGEDNDRDGLIDVADLDCAPFYPSQPLPPPPPPPHPVPPPPLAPTSTPSISPSSSTTSSTPTQ